MSAGTAKAKSPISGAALIVAVTFAAYLPALQAGFIWDDDAMLTNNKLVQSADGLKRLWFSTEPVDYFPLTYSSLWLEWRLWGMNPLGYHISNILLHAFSAVILWRVLRQLNIPGAWWGALIFAIHPVSVESVAWIAERKNTLCLFFFVLTIWFFLKGNPTAAPKSSVGPMKWYWLALGAFTLALLSKTSVVLLPVVLLCMAWWMRGRIDKQDLLRVAPFFALSLAAGLATIWFQYNRAIQAEVVNAGSLAERVVIAGRAVWFYVFKAVWPLNLAAVYPRWPIDPHSITSYLPAVAVAAALGSFWIFRKTWGRPLLFAFTYFLAMLLPVLGFLNIYFQRFSPVADHWQYFALIGIVTLVAAAVTSHLGKFSTAALAGLAAVLGILTWQQTKIYKDEETLWRDTVAKNPNSWLPRQNLGTILLARGNIKEAEEQLKTAISLGAKRGVTNSASLNVDAKADEVFTRGLTLLANENPDSALLEFRKAIEMKPDWPDAMNEAAWILATHPEAQSRNGAEALRLAKRSCELTQYKQARFLGTLDAAYAAAGQFKDAIATAEKARALFLNEGKVEMAQEAMKRIKFYQAGQPYHQ